MYPKTAELLETLGLKEGGDHTGFSTNSDNSSFIFKLLWCRHSQCRILNMRKEDTLILKIQGPNTSPHTFNSNLPEAAKEKKYKQLFS